MTWLQQVCVLIQVLYHNLLYLPILGGATAGIFPIAAAPALSLPKR